VMKVDTVHGLLYVKGAVPGPQDRYVRIRDAVRRLWHDQCFPAGQDVPYPTHFGLLKEQRDGLLASEVEFVAESEPVVIVPQQRAEAIELISGVYGPFRPLQQYKVPLWLALMLKKLGKCKIETPDWMLLDQLKAKIDQELMSENFAELPFHYMETAHLLLTHASDDIARPTAVHAALKTLHDIRRRKCIDSLRLMNADLAHSDHIALDNLGLMEINEIRPFYVKAFEEIRRLTRDLDADAAAAPAAGPGGYIGGGGGSGGGSGTFDPFSSSMDLA
ncbi:DNA replication protein psf2, partial [Cladochytrium tenue]